jgi:hypothetical protein
MADDTPALHPEDGTVLPPRMVGPVLAAKAEKAWAVRVAGGTWRQAAEVSGYGSGEAAQKAVSTVRGATPRVSRDVLREVWRDRLEMAWRQVAQDMSQQRPGAVTAAVRIATAAMHLDGLAEPVRVDVSVQETFERIERELGVHGL